MAGGCRFIIRLTGNVPEFFGSVQPLLTAVTSACDAVAGTGILLPLPLDSITDITYRKNTMTSILQTDSANPVVPGMEEATFARLCKALGHPARLQIIRHLKAIDHCLCGELVGLLPLAQSTVSQHLKYLKEAGLIKGQVEGPCTCYCLDRDMLAKFTTAAGQL